MAEKVDTFERLQIVGAIIKSGGDGVDAIERLVWRARRYPEKRTGLA